MSPVMIIQPICWSPLIAGDTYALLTADVAEILVPGHPIHARRASLRVRGLFEQRNAPMLALSPTVLLGRTLRAEEDGGIAVVVEARKRPPYS